MKLRVGITVEANIDADPALVAHFNATGEVTEAMKLSIERAEIALQKLVDRGAKRMNAVVGADYSSLHIQEARV